jgi:tryptophan synthase alpha chain
VIAATDRLGALFTKARDEKRAALIVYLVAGDPDAATTAAIIDAISPHVDLIELGIPYGDPLADGPTIAAAGQRALGAGMTLDGALALARDANARGSAPILFFTYVNPIVQYGTARFAAAARAAGAVGAIVPDVPLEELDTFAPAFAAEGLAIPLLVAPTTPRRATASSTSSRASASRAPAAIPTSRGSARRSSGCAPRRIGRSRSASASRRRRTSPRSAPSPTA